MAKGKFNAHKQEAQKRAGSLKNPKPTKGSPKKATGTAHRKQPPGVTGLTPYLPADAANVRALPGAEAALFEKYNIAQMMAGAPVILVEQWLALGKPQPRADVYTPANPGKKTDPVNPYLTPQEMIQYGDAEYKETTDRDGQTSALAKLVADTALGKADIDRRAHRQTQAAQDEAIGRGLFQSSIKDGALWDIEKTRSTSKQRLDDNLTTATTNAETALANLTNWWTNFQKQSNQLAVNNAQTQGSQLPEYKPGQGPKPESFKPPTPVKPHAKTLPSPYDGFIESVKKGFVGHAGRTPPRKPPRTKKPPRAGSLGA